jgi:hypothetical protein
MGKWCARCIHDPHGKEDIDGLLEHAEGCDILASAMAGAQPDEWREDERGARCSAFAQDPADETIDPAAVIRPLL